MAYQEEEMELDYDSFNDDEICPICGRDELNIHDACMECGYNPYSDD